jgi:hypothetical protein
MPEAADAGTNRLLFERFFLSISFVILTGQFRLQFHSFTLAKAKLCSG